MLAGKEQHNKTCLWHPNLHFDGVANIFANNLFYLCFTKNK